jgi:hypothetical protein
MLRARSKQSICFERHKVDPPIAAAIITARTTYHRGGISGVMRNHELRLGFSGMDRLHFLLRRAWLAANPPAVMLLIQTFP